MVVSDREATAGPVRESGNGNQEEWKKGITIRYWVSRGEVPRVP